MFCCSARWSINACVLHFLRRPAAALVNYVADFSNTWRLACPTQHVQHNMFNTVRQAPKHGKHTWSLALLHEQQTLHMVECVLEVGHHILQVTCALPDDRLQAFDKVLQLIWQQQQTQDRQNMVENKIRISCQAAQIATTAVPPGSVGSELVIFRVCDLRMAHDMKQSEACVTPPSRLALALMKLRLFAN